MTEPEIIKYFSQSLDILKQSLLLLKLQCGNQKYFLMIVLILHRRLLIVLIQN